MKKVLLVASAAILFLASCSGSKNCYMCVTTNSNNFNVVSRDTVMKCDFTTKDANEYVIAHTVNGTPGDPYPGDTKACSCQVPTK